MEIENIFPLILLQVLNKVFQYIFLFLDRFFFSKDKAMSEMSNSNFSKTTSIQQAIASCCGAIITSLFGKVY